ncbi:MAG: 4-hydroxy-tetrahydrodipicolinate synthase [Defluviitaleaceae bacterium]|nr:4-hydroxy-tetrahydrodipicolinate synthase [Defluviitaleaceae bacterium]
MNNPIFKGSCTAIITPFTKDSSAIDYDSFERLLSFQLDNGTSAIVVCGTTGESPTITETEYKSIIGFAASRLNGRIPLIAGVGSNNTSYASTLAKSAKLCKADGVMAVTPYYNKTTQDGLMAHYKEIAAVGVPVMVYNVPSRTGLNILPETYAKLSKIPGIDSVKEANSDFSALTTTLDLTDGRLSIYCGNDDETVPFLAMGAVGVVSVLANIVPRQIAQICESFFNGEIKKARELQISLNELHRATFCEINPIPIKYALKQMGYATGALRLPLVEIQSQNAVRIMELCKNL